MTTIDVRDETKDHARLAAQIHDVITHAAPLVEQITGLRLPSTVTYRLMGTEPWGQAIGAFHGRTAQRDTAGMTLTPGEQRQIAAFSSQGVRGTRLSWIMIDSWTVTDSIGRPQTLIVPDALRHQGVLDTPEVLSERVVRALAHQAQISASNSAVLPPRIWPLESTWWRRLECLTDGHANWVGHQVTPHLPDKPTADPHLPKSRRYLVQSLICRMLEPGVPKRQLQGERFVAYITRYGNLELFNRVWADPDWVPKLDEFSQPHAWLRRVNGG